LAEITDHVTHKWIWIDTFHSAAAQTTFLYAIELVHLHGSPVRLNFPLGSSYMQYFAYFDP
jgi:hypothetical protein